MLDALLQFVFYENIYKITAARLVFEINFSSSKFFEKMSILSDWATEWVERRETGNWPSSAVCDAQTMWK